MPVTVVVRSGQGGPAGSRIADDVPSLTFDGDRVVIGRGMGCDVPLPDPSVSARHATIRAMGSDYAVVDEGSTNGTFVGGVRLLPQTPRIVKNGALVRVGRVWLELSVGQRMATPDLGLATRDLAFALVRRAMDAVGDDTITKVRVAEGPDIGEEMLLVDEGRAYLLGRAESCDLPLADADASREHAAVVRRRGQVLLRDLGSRNGVWLGETRIPPDRDVPWRAPTMARLGLTVLALDEPVMAILAELELAADEAMREEDVPPEPTAEAAEAAEAADPDSPQEGSRESSRDGTAAADPPAAAAPDGLVPEAPSRRPSQSPGARRRGWTVTDVLVVTLALGVMAASIAGLVWVLR